jgi:hypothetical protein
MLAALPLLSFVERDVAAALLPRLDPVALAEAIAACPVPLPPVLAGAVLDHGDPRPIGALAAHVREQFPDVEPVDDYQAELHDYGVPPQPLFRYEPELPLIWPPHLLHRLDADRRSVPRPWRPEWADGPDGPTGVPAHLTLPDGVSLPWPADVLASAWTDLLAYPEGRALTRSDLIMAMQRGVITGVFPAERVVHGVRPASLALSPWWWPARLTTGRLRVGDRYRLRVIEAAVDGRTAVARLLDRLGDDPGRWSALLAGRGSAGTLPELVERAYAHPVAGPPPAEALLGWLIPFAAPDVVDALLARCPDADLSRAGALLARRTSVIRDAVVDRIVERAGITLAGPLSRRVPWLAHLLLAQGSPEVTAAVHRPAAPVLDAPGDLIGRMRREPDRDTLTLVRRGRLDWPAVLAEHGREPLPPLIAQILAGRGDCGPAAHAILTAHLDPALPLPPVAGRPDLTIANLAARPAPPLHDLMTAGLSVADMIRHVRPAGRLLTDGGGELDEVTIRAGMLVRRELGTDPGRWLAAVRALTEGFTGTLPALLSAAR